MIGGGANWVVAVQNMECHQFLCNHHFRIVKRDAMLSARDFYSINFFHNDNIWVFDGEIHVLQANFTS